MNDSSELKGNMFNIQKYSIYDGPGTRTLIFLKGCPLKCKWCSNPESISEDPQIMYLKDQCTSCGDCVSVCPEEIFYIDNKTKKLKINREKKCIGCRKCEKECYTGAVRIAGKKISVNEAIKIILEDIYFYWSSGGGVTIGGGEPTKQYQFTTELLKKCKEKGIHTALETSGFIKWNILKEISYYTDLFLYDIKHMDDEEHKKLTGVSNFLILENLKKLIKVSNVIIRIPLIPGINDSEKNLINTVNFIQSIKESTNNLIGIEVLPYHRLGINKYKQIDKDYEMSEVIPYSKKNLENIEESIKSFNLPIRLVRH